MRRPSSSFRAEAEGSGDGDAEWCGVLWHHGLLLAYEAIEILEKEGICIDTLRIRSFPFNEDVEQFIRDHDRIFVIEQNRDGQMRRLLLNETSVPVKDRLIPILEYDGLPVTARKIAGMIRNFITLGNVTPITRRAQAEEISA